MTLSLRQYTILGERNSGTHFLQYAMQFNFPLLRYDRREKHFFGQEANRAVELADPHDTLFLCIVRDPVEWVDSLFKRLHHVPRENKTSIRAFLDNPWYSVDETRNHEEITKDRHLVTGERYKDIFEMRCTKLWYMQKVLPALVPHVYFLRYEDLRDNYETTLLDVAHRFGLPVPAVWRPVTQIKGTFTERFVQKPVLLSEEVQQEVRRRAVESQCRGQ